MHSELILYTAFNSLKCSIFFKQIKFNQFKIKILRIVNFLFYFKFYSLKFSKNINYKSPFSGHASLKRVSFMFCEMTKTTFDLRTRNIK